MSVPLRRLVTGTSTFLLAMLLTAATASAATLTLSGGTLTYTAGGGNISDLIVSQDDPGGTDPNDIWVVRQTPVTSFGVDDDAITANGCSDESGTFGVPAGTLFRCQNVSSIVMSLGDRNDSMDADFGFTGSFTGVRDQAMNVDAGEGDDHADTGDGGDTINLGPGGDDSNGSGGGDTINGGTGNDGLDGGAGDDTANGEDGNDFLAESSEDVTDFDLKAGNNTLTGGDGADSIAGGDEVDNVSGGAGADNVSGGLGVDTVAGDDGDDTVAADPDGAADASYSGGPGTDTMSYAPYGGGVTVILDGVANDGTAGENDPVAGDFENAIGGDGPDTVTGNNGMNQLSGGDGADTINGLGEDDGLFGGSSADALNGGDGRDTVIGGDGADVLNGENGDDLLDGSGGADVFNGGFGLDTADFSARFFDVVVSLNRVADDGTASEGDNADADGQVENVLTGGGNDRVSGNEGENYIATNAGNDLINLQDGQIGNVDIGNCGPGFDQVSTNQFDSVDLTGPDRCEIAPEPDITRTRPTITLNVRPRRDRTFPHQFTTSGRIDPGIVPRAFACTGTDFVAVQWKNRGATISTRRAPVQEDCTYTTQVTFNVRRRLRRSGGVLRAQAVFSGNRYLSPARSPRRNGRIR